jgi:hypothetical protein
MSRGDRFTLLELILADLQQSVWHLARITPKWLGGLQGFGNYSHGKSAWRMFCSALSRPYWHAWRWWNCIDRITELEMERNALHFQMYMLMKIVQSVPRTADGPLNSAIQEAARVLDRTRPNK